MNGIDVLRSLVSVPAGLLLVSWLAASWAWVGPEIGTRILTADHVQACRQVLTEARTEAGDDRVKDIVAAVLGLPRWMADAIPFDRLNAEQRRLVDQALDGLGLVPRSSSGLNGVDPCTCAVANTVERDQLQWALFAASAGLVRTGPLRELERVLPTAAAAAPCAPSQSEAGL